MLFFLVPEIKNHSEMAVSSKMEPQQTTQKTSNPVGLGKNCLFFGGAHSKKHKQICRTMGKFAGNPLCLVVS
jgi:hypothetical protein